MHNSQNKEDLNRYLAGKIISLHSGSQIVVVTFNNSILSNDSSSLIEERINNCTFEEADPRLVRHAVHAYNISANLWLCVKVMCKGLPFFYSLTGCGTVSIFNIGKCTVWDSLLLQENVEDLLDTFQELSNKPNKITSSQIDVLERFVQRVYYPKNMKPKGVNKERLVHFKRLADINLHAILFSRSGLIEHTKRACLQGGWLWNECLHNVSSPDPTWGWEKTDEGLIPFWQEYDNPIHVDDIIKTCICKVNGCKTCKCTKSKMKCLPFCGCERTCNNS